MKQVILRPLFIRKFPDPMNRQIEEGAKVNIEHFIAICQASSLPDDIPLGPNPRAQNLDRGIYKEVKKSLENESDPTFLLKNKGITIIAQNAIQSENKSELTVFFSGGDGIIDGGHTYRIIQESKENCPPNQYVRIEILTGVPEFQYDLIAEGLNTAVQVQQMSLANLRDEFDWIKSALQKKPYFDSIAFKENEEGKYDARDIVGLLTLFNIDLFSESSNTHPKVAYTSKAKTLELFLDKKNKPSFMSLKNILPDILELHDYVHFKSLDLYNKKYKGKGGKLAFNKSRKRGVYNYIFLGAEGKNWLYDGALYPILASLRYLVEIKHGAEFYSWKVGSLNDVKKLFDNVGADLINITRNTSDKEGRNPNAIGKDDNHWAFLYQTVAFALLQQKKERAA
ncbi:MAG TPA: AIPR family protein [candidate division Zixibacteria bacterium]|nr:AIPR family protein [candidate division Zixibacteria bacterium]